MTAKRLRRRSPTLRLPPGSFELLTRMAPIGIFHTDAQGRAVYTNEQWTRICGISAARSRGDGWLRAVHPDDRPRVFDQWRVSVAGGDEYRAEYRIVRPSGEVRYVSARGVAVYSKAGRLRGHVGTIEDVTERVLVEQQLEGSTIAHRFSLRRLEALFAYSSDAIMLTDDSGRYVEANPAACELLGASRAEILAMSAVDVVPPHLRDGFEARWRGFLASGERAGDDVVQRRDGTTRDVDLRAVAHVMPGTHLSILRDVTERNQAERAREHEVQRLKILAGIDFAILNARSRAAIADAVVEQVGRVFPAIRASILLFDFAARTATIAAVWSAAPTRLGAGTTMSLDHDLSGPAALLRQPAVVRDFAAEQNGSSIGAQLHREGVRSLVRLPLCTNTDVIGALIISSALVDGFTADYAAIAQDVAARAAVAIANARLVEAVHANSARVAAMSKRLVAVQELERRDIARELHDEVGQVLTGLKLQIELAIRRAPADVAVALVESATLVHDLLGRVRRLSLNLRPPLLGDFGLERALAAHFERFTKQTAVRVAFTSDGLARERIAVQAGSAAFRIVQESLTNVARHAGIDSVEVTVRIVDQRVDISVGDHGRGFDCDSPHHGCSGLSGMHERIALLGGTLRVASAPGQGTTISAQIPLPPSRQATA